MKIKLLLCTILVLLLALPLSAAPPKTKGGTGSSYSATIDNVAAIDVNRIYMFVTNHGNFGRDLSDVFGYDYGTWYPYTGNPDDIANNINNAGNKSPNYASGIWIGGKVGTDTRVAISEYSSEFVPGPMANGYFQVDNSSFKTYKLFKDSTGANANSDYTNWPVDQGAPTDSVGNPALVGDQMLWSVYNDADTAQHSNMHSIPLGVEIKQSVFGFDRQGSLGNMVFIRYRVFNNGPNTIDSMFISLWCDPDLGNASDDLVGSDSLLGLGYVYNESPTDANYPGTVVPSMGFDFFQGPLVETGDQADTALMWGYAWPGYKNLGMVSFNKYSNGTDPDDPAEVYGYMLGLDPKNSYAPYTYLGQPVAWQHTGDPVAGTGDLDVNAADRRFMQTTGPFTFAPGDSTEIIAAVVIGQGTDYLNSISIMKNLDEYAQRTYEGKIDPTPLTVDGKTAFKHFSFLPPDPPAKPVVTASRIQDEIIISWGDTSVVDPGAYEFEGFTVWQGASENGPWTELATYDAINDRTDALVDSVVDSYSGTKQPQVLRAIKNSGLAYTYNATKDVVGQTSFKNLKKYYFKVSAFSYAFAADDGDTLWTDIDGNVIPVGDRFLESAAIVTVIPQAPLAGEHASADVNEVLPVTHSGLSDGAVLPTVLDPLSLNGHTYMVVFEEITPIDIVWHLIDATTGDTVLFDQVNQSGNDEYVVVDGMQIKVTGPPLAGKDWDYTSASPANISPVALADDPSYAGGRWFTGGNHGGELLFGGIFMEPNFWGETTVLPADYPTVEIRWRPMASYTDLNGDGTYTIGEPYVVDNPALTQKGFMYSGFSGSSYLGFYDLPFQAWDVSDPANPRQLNVCMRDRDQNLAWNLHVLHDPAEVDITGLPNGGDLQFNYTFITNTDYDPTGTYYGDGNGGTVDIWSDFNVAWTMWLDDRGNGGTLAEECILTLIPPVLNLSTDTFTFVASAPTFTQAESDLDKIKAVPNPFYMNGPYDPAIGSYEVKFNNLPANCSIDIYNLAGEHIRKLEKDDPTVPTLGWDLYTTQGLPVASGIYIYVVDAPGFGQKVGKMAVFVEQEVLKIY